MDAETPTLDEIELPGPGGRVEFQIKWDPYTLTAHSSTSWTLYAGARLAGSFVLKGERYWITDDDRGLIDPRDNWRTTVLHLA